MHSRVHAFLTHPPYSQSSKPRVQDRHFSRFFQFLAPQKYSGGGLAPIWVWHWKLQSPPIVW